MTGENDNSSASKLTKIQFKDDVEKNIICASLVTDKNIMQASRTIFILQLTFTCYNHQTDWLEAETRLAKQTDAVF